MLYLTDKRYCIATNTAAEAIEAVFGRIYGEGRGFLTMKRSKPLEIRAGTLKINVTANKIFYIVS
jgi:hypothetical protein